MSLSYKMEAKSRQDHRPILAALYYIASSCVLTVINKLLFKAWPSLHVPTLVLSQSLSSLVVFMGLGAFRMFHFPRIKLHPARAAGVVLPLLATYAGMLSMSLLALQNTTLLMCNTLRRTSIIFVVILHSLFNGTIPSFYTFAAVVLTVCGAFYAGKADLVFDPVGYSLAIAANFSAALYLTLIRPVRDKLAVSNMQLLFISTLGIMPIHFTVLHRYRGESSFLEMASSGDRKTVLLYLASCAMATIISHATYLNTTVNDAIAQTVSAQVKDVVLLIASVLFIDSPSERGDGNIVGAMIGFVGSLIYAVGKTRQNRNSSTRSRSE